MASFPKYFYLFGLRRTDTSSVSENLCVNKSKLSVKSEKVEETKDSKQRKCATDAGLFC